MTSAKEIYDYINNFAPFESAMSFDNVGILVGSEKTCSEKVIAALDVDKKVINEAVKKNAKIVITHHPVIFNPLKNLSENSIPFIAAKYGITIISAHTNLDIARSGVNDSLAECIGITPYEHCDEACALMGKISEYRDCDEFAVYIKKQLALKGLRYTNNGKEIKNILVSCGAGGDNIFLAAKLGADAFVTGEIKHHEIVFANDNSIAVFDLGHFGSEDIIIPRLVKMLSKRFDDTAFEQAESDNDGLIYVS